MAVNLGARSNSFKPICSPVHDTMKNRNQDHLDLFSSSDGGEQEHLPRQILAPSQSTLSAGIIGDRFDKHWFCLFVNSHTPPDPLDAVCISAAQQFCDILMRLSELHVPDDLGVPARTAPRRGGPRQFVGVPAPTLPAYPNLIQNFILDHTVTPAKNLADNPTLLREKDINLIRKVVMLYFGSRWSKVTKHSFTGKLLQEPKPQHTWCTGPLTV